MSPRPTGIDASGHLTSVEWSYIRFNCAEPSLTRSPDLWFQSLGKEATLDLSTQL